MYKLLFPSVFSFLFISFSVNAQLQSVDGEGSSQAAGLKKLDKKAKYGISQAEKEFNFTTGKGIDDLPVVVARETGSIEMVSIDSKVQVGYLLPYNNFVKLRDYDFGIFYKNNFKSQKYPPEKISLTDESVFFDDNFGMFYGFRAEEAGQRCRFQYDYEYTDAKYLTRIFFHQGIPAKQQVIRFKVPSWLDLDIVEKNFGTYKIKKEVKKDKNITIYTYTAENMVGTKQEPSSLARPYYLPHLVITVRSFLLTNKKINCLSSLDDMYAWYNLLYKKAGNKTEELKPVVEQLTKGQSTDEAKIKALYYWVQDNIRYIAFEEGYSGYVPQSTQEVFKNKYGDCKGMANLLTEMLKLAGYDAHFSWIGTREIPYDRKEIQSLCVDNHAICVLYFKGKTYFLDGTEKYGPFGRDAYRIQGKNVLVQDGEKYKVETVPLPAVEENQIVTKATLALKEGNKISGHVKISFDGESRSFFHYIYNAIPASKRKEFINHMVELNNNNAEVTNVKTSDFNNRDLPIVLEADIEISNQVTKAGNQLYTSIDFFPETITGFIPSENRQNPFDLDNVFTSIDEITLDLPSNIKPGLLPKNFQATFSKNSMEAVYSSTANKILLKKKFQLGTPVIYPEEFAGWKEYLAKIREFNRQNMTLTIQ